MRLLQKVPNAEFLLNPTPLPETCLLLLGALARQRNSVPEI